MFIEAENNYNLNQQKMQFFHFFFPLKFFKEFSFFPFEFNNFSLCGPISQTVKNVALI